MLAWQFLAAVMPFETTSQGVLVGIVPRAILCGLPIVAALGSLAGIVSLTLVRRRDLESLAILGILIRSLFGIGIGLVSEIVLWLIIGHLVIGF